MEESNIYFNAGDLVTINKDLPNKPIMMVVKKETFTFKHDNQNKKPNLIGIRCIWFTENKEKQEAIFSTKDLELIK